MDETDRARFYEDFWKDADYQLRYARDAAERDRFPAILKVWGDLDPPERVLDFGSGNGVLTQWMHRNGFGAEVLGLDVSETGVAFARRQFGCDTLAYGTIAPGERVDPGDRPFDALVSSHVLEHIEDPVAALRALRGVAHRYVLEVPLEDALGPAVFAAMRGRDRRDNPVGHVNFWTRDSFRRTVEEAGFHIERDYRYASAPYSPFAGRFKKGVQRVLLAGLGVGLYGRLTSTHYTVLARER